MNFQDFEDNNEQKLTDACETVPFHESFKTIPVDPFDDQREEVIMPDFEDMEKSILSMKVKEHAGKITISDEYDIDYDDSEVKEFFRRTFTTDKKAFRKYGPINPFVPTGEYLRKCPTSPEGKCAMMTCICHEYQDEDFPDEIEDWFTGICKSCKEPIQNRTKAFRVPLSNGGFKHCTCDKLCARSMYSHYPEAFEHQTIEILSVYLDKEPITFEDLELKYIDSLKPLIKILDDDCKPEVISTNDLYEEDDDEDCCYFNLEDHEIPLEYVEEEEITPKVIPAKKTPLKKVMFESDEENE